MRVSVGLPSHRVDAPEEFLTGAALTEMARSAEAARFDAVFVTEHPFPGDRWLSSGGHHALDPFVALSFAAAATTRLRLQTNLFIPSYRNPFLAAKAVASLDALSGGRVILGIGTGYLESEFAALGVDFDERNDLTDEAIVAMRVAWEGRSVDALGRHYRATGNTMLPRPVQRPGPPIWVGGNSKRAIRRAVELGDGWAPMPNPARSAARRRSPALATIDDLRALVAYAHVHGERTGRAAPLEVAFMPTGLDMFRDGSFTGGAVVDNIAELRAAGVTYVTVAIPGRSRAEWQDNLYRFGAEVVVPSAAI